MKITKSWLKKKSVCPNFYDYFAIEYKRGVELTQLLSDLKEDGKIEWSWWLLKQVLTKRKAVEIAIYAAESVLTVLEKKYPKDKLTKKAIETAKAWLKNPCEKTRLAARSAGYAVGDTQRTAWAAECSVTTDFARSAAKYVEYTAEAAEWAAWAAAWPRVSDSARAAERAAASAVHSIRCVGEGMSDGIDFTAPLWFENDILEYAIKIL
jgi:hypothetical protein